MGSYETSMAVRKVLPRCRDASGSISGSGRAKIPGRGDFCLSLRY